MADSTAVAAAGAGLSSEEAADRLKQFGPNEPAAKKRGGPFLELLQLFLNPLVVILLIAAGASFALGDRTDAIVILVIICLGVAINFIQTYRSQKAIDKLRENVTPTATVLRDGTWQEIKRREVVPGDLVRLSAGDLVPADARLLEARDLYAQQSALTGESLPVEKEAKIRDGKSSTGPDALNLVFLGTSVVSGTATAKVLKTDCAPDDFSGRSPRAW